MPRKNIDYSQTHFYKIVCKDLGTKDIYIGHTTDFNKRKSCHKLTSANQSNRNYTMPVYQFIRENGGWSNFDMILIETQCLNSSLEARKKEREYIEQHGATLNKCRAYSSQEEKVEQQNQWYIDNKEHCKDKAKQYRLDNPEKKKQMDKNYYETNKAHCNQQSKEYYENHKEKVLEKSKKYYQENKERQKQLRRERYARQKLTISED